MIPIRIIKKLIHKNVDKEKIASRLHEGADISVSNFHGIGDGASAEAYAIDGGSSIIADAGPWIVAKIKVAVVRYKKRTFTQVKEFYAVVITRESYEIHVLDSEWNEIEHFSGFDSLDITEVPSKVMKIMEWKECLNLCSGKEGIVALMDTGIDPDNEFEKSVIEKVMETNNTIVGFCKTSRMRTNSGRSALGAISKLSDGRDVWYYYPVFLDEKEMKTFVSKLHKNSKYCYKIQISSKESHDSVFRILRFLASDLELLGYPYILSLADKMARITSFEQKLEKRRFERELKDSDLEYDMRSNSFHKELDDRMYK